MKRIFLAIRHFVLNVITSGTFEALDLEKRRRVILVNLLIMTGSLALLIFGTRALQADNIILAIVEYATAVLFMVPMLVLRVKKWIMPVSIFIVLVESLLFGSFMVMKSSSMGQILWIYVLPISSVFLLNLRWGSLISLAFFVYTILVFALPGPWVRIIEKEIMFRFLGSYLLVYFFAAFYEGVRNSTNKRLMAATAQLAAAKKQTDDIMANVNEGILLLDGDFKVGSEFSRASKKLIGTNLSGGESFLELLKGRIGDNDLKATADYLGLFHDSNVNRDLLPDINPLDRVEISSTDGSGSVANRNLVFEFTPIDRENQTGGILVTARDITEEVRLEQQLLTQRQKAQKEMETLFQIIRVDPEMLTEFLEDSDAELDFVNQLMKSEDENYVRVLRQIFQSIHSVKGNALLLGLDRLGNKLHILEEGIKQSSERGPAWKDLLDMTLAVGEIKKEMENIRQLLDQVNRFQQRMQEAQFQKKDLLVYALERWITRFSSDAGLQVQLDTTRFQPHHIQKDQRKLIKDICVQMTRNSLAHGIETPDERTAGGKPPTGTLTLETRVVDGSLEIRFADDGRGLNINRIREKAMQLPELKSKDPATLSAGELVRLIFHPGFSTAGKEDTTAGRGMGMSYVKSAVERNGGTLSLKTKPGRFTEFLIKLPAAG
jgi:two-component system chemotaxis sensor kinase CheA